VILSRRFLLQNTIEPLYRVLDANLNRLREALRVVEDYFRFIKESPEICEKLKLSRHKLIKIEELLGKEQLLKSRNTLTDCFADENRPEELLRETTDDLVSANFKRAQEAARVIEEYSKLTGNHEVSGIAKALRFSFYTLEQDSMEKRHE